MIIISMIIDLGHEEIVISNVGSHVSECTVLVQHKSDCRETMKIRLCGHSDLMFSVQLADVLTCV